jgi:outer membrane protein assembly factor BamB
MFPIIMSTSQHALGCWRTGGLTLVSLILLTPLFAQIAPPVAVPAEIEGRWSGEVRHDNETGFAGFEFQRQPDGRVLARAWLPNLNAYGSPVGWVTVAEGRLIVREANFSPALFNGVLTGSFYQPDLTVIARHTTEPFPAELEPPSVDPGPEPAWIFHAGAPLWAGPVVADDIAYIGDSGGKFHAVRVSDGQAQWTYDAGAPLFGTAAVMGDAVYFVADNGRLYKLARKTGVQLWRADVGGSGIRSVPALGAQEWDYLTATPVIVGDTVYIGSADGVFRALAADTGKPRWSFKAGGKFRAAAQVAGERVYVGSMDHFVYALDRQTGVQRWRFDTGSPVTTTPVLVGNKLVIGTRDQSTLFALNAADGKKVWTVYFWLSWVESTPALVDGLLYIGASDSRRVRAIEPDTGHVRWAVQVWGWTWGTPLVVGDTVYYGTAGAPQYFIAQKASLGALDRQTGALKWRKPIPLLEKGYVCGIAGSLAYVDGKMLAANLDGTLSAFVVPRPSATGESH